MMYKLRFWNDQQLKKNELDMKSIFAKFSWNQFHGISWNNFSRKFCEIDFTEKIPSTTSSTKEDGNEISVDATTYGKVSISSKRTLLGTKT